MATFTEYVQGTPCYVELTTPDPAAGAAFYAGLLGWDIAETPLPEEMGGVYRQGRIEEATVAGITGQMPGLEGHPAFWGVYLAADDVDAATAKVEPAGGKVDAPPFDVMDLGRMAAIQDPTGARVNLWQAAASVGTERANEPGTPCWNEVNTPDVAKALAFYTAVLGTGVEEMEFGEGEVYSSITDVDGRVVAGACPPPFEGVPPHWNVYFQVESADLSGARVTELGGTVVAPNTDVPEIGRFGFYADPQGALFALLQPPAAAE